MSVKTYSLKTDGETKLAANFKVKEFRCKDGSDGIKVDTDLVELLQKIRTHFGKPLTINSGYRTKTYNTKVGGAPASKHLYGKAADIRVSGTEPLAVAKYAEEIGALGIGWYKGQAFTHVDTRANKVYWCQISAGDANTYISTFENL